MKLNMVRYLIVILIFTLSGNAYLNAQADIEAVFRNPPHDARPRGYWLWAHGNFDYERIREELGEFRRMGLGGVDIYDMGIQDNYDVIPAGNPFLGEKMLDGIEFALKEAKQLDLAMGLSVSNGWNTGAGWTTPDEMIMRLLFWIDTIRGPAEIREIGFPELPTSFEKLYGSFELFPRYDEEGFPLYYQDVALMAFQSGTDGLIPDKEQVRYFKSGDIEDNQINIELPEGEWILARAVVCPLFQRMWMRSDRSDGFIMDHYSHKATRHHFNEVIARLESRMGNLGESSLERLYLASFEAEDYIIWSPELKEEFFRIHGYGMDAYMPAFAGMIIESEEVTDRFLHDYRLTVSEMFVNNHYRQARDICHQHNVLLASESGGPGPPLHHVPTEDLKALGAVDIMRGEFWNRKAQYLDEHGNDITQVVKNIGSAAHIYGRKIVEMEAFTSHRKHWQERPIELKKLADQAFCEGMTRVVYHTMPHSPKEAGVPGWSYQAGTHISPKMAWWDLSKPFHDYLARTSALLQQGLYVADVAYYYGEEIPKFASGTKYIRKSLGKDYSYDDLNKEVLLLADVSPEGYLVLPSGMKYRLLVLDDTRMMSLNVARKIEHLVREGVTILGDRPMTVPGLKDYQHREEMLHEITRKLWPRSAGKSRKVGSGRIYLGTDEREILAGLGVGPDFHYQISEGNRANLDFIHRATDQEDIYFIRNEDSVQVAFVADFRVKGKQPWIFDPKDGSIQHAGLFSNMDNGIRLPLSLESYGSVFIVFREKMPSEQLVSGFQSDCIPIRASGIALNGPWEVRFEHGWGFEPVQQFDSLIDWTKHQEEGIRAYGGRATYHGSFRISPEVITSNKNIHLDLGVVGDVARVYLNGEEIGSAVFPPYRFEISDALREGENYLSIEVANTWLNRLIYDATLPFDEQATSSNVGGGDRENPVRYWQNYKPLPSGLMGPVSIFPCETISLE